MKALVTGATGFLGQRLVAGLRREGYAISAVSREASRITAMFGPDVTGYAWDDTLGWHRAVAEADVVFHLAGEPVVTRRWTPALKEEMRASRIETTHAIASAGPRLLIQASAVGYYGNGGNRVLTEDSPAGTDFLAHLCRDWERAVEPAQERGGRVIVIRIGIVLGQDGGPLAMLLNPPGLPFSPWRLGLGGPLGSGRQWFPWIHLDDVVSLLLWSASQSDLSGPVNATAPELVTNAQFSALLGRTLGRPALLPIPAPALRSLLGEFADYLLYSQRIVPKVAQERGFTFRFADLATALTNLLCD